MDVGFIGLGHMGAPMALTCRRPAIPSPSTMVPAARRKPCRASALKSPSGSPMLAKAMFSSRC
jgi:3-hydroxyisobutyrate dehydrogenase-like beta-hydroxyacid dehydrogenase